MVDDGFVDSSEVEVRPQGRRGSLNCNSLKHETEELVRETVAANWTEGRTSCFWCLQLLSMLETETELRAEKLEQGGLPYA